jgi:hypothetical protein
MDRRERDPDLESYTLKKIDPGFHDAFPKVDPRPLKIKLKNAAKPEVVKYSYVNGLTLFEGDIDIELDKIVTREPVSLGKKTGLLFSKKRYRWPNKEVPYAIDPDYPREWGSQLRRAINHWNDKTILRFIKVPPDPEDHEYPNYIYFRDSYRCGSKMGMRGGRQDIEVMTKGARSPEIIHEIGHAVGLWHEHSRHDRNKYIKIVRKNIPRKKQHNFKRRYMWDKDFGEYDYFSIMHYKSDAFTKNGEDTIIVKNDYDTYQPLIGKAEGLSEMDIKAVKAIYDDDVITDLTPLTDIDNRI